MLALTQELCGLRLRNGAEAPASWARGDRLEMDKGLARSQAQSRPSMAAFLSPVSHRGKSAPQGGEGGEPAVVPPAVPQTTVA